MKRYITLLLAAIIGAFMLTAAEARIPRSSAAKTAFVRLHACPSTGLHKLPCPGWILDHKKALACDGVDAPSNLQWQTIADAKAKDKWERCGPTCSPRQSGAICKGHLS